MTVTVPVNIDRLKVAVYDLRWLGSIAALAGDQAVVRGNDRRTLAALIAGDIPALISEVEQQRSDLAAAEKTAAAAADRAEQAETELAALRDSNAQRTPWRV